MEKSQKNKIILRVSRLILIINIIIVYGVFFISYLNKDKINPYTSFPWYTNTILISTILSLPTFIFVFIYQYYYRQIYFKLPLKIHLFALYAFVLGMFTSKITFFIGNIPFFIIANIFIISLVFFIITLIYTVRAYLMQGKD